MHRYARLIKSERTAAGLVATLFTAAAVCSLGWWLSTDPCRDLQVRLPGMDGTPQDLSGGGEAVRIGEGFQRFAVLAAAAPGSWPRFRGADSRNVLAESTPLADSWEGGAPRLLWSVDLGEGHAGAAVWGGRVYLLDYDEEAEADALRCFSLADGVELWRRSYGVKVKRNHGMSRSIPAVGGGFAVSLGPRGHVMCVDAETGDFLWGIDLAVQYGAEIPPWYTAQCPLIDGGTAVIAPGGTALMLGVDCRTGEVLWETPNLGGWKMSHSSIMPMTLDGIRTYVYCALGGVAAVAAEGERRGQILWATDLWSPEVAAPSPVILEGHRIFLTAGYGAGSMLLRIERADAAAPQPYTAAAVASYAPGEALSCEQQTPIYRDGLLYGVAPKDAGSLRNQLICFDPDRLEIVWSSGKTERFGLGPYLAADDKLYLLSDDGVLSMIDLTAGSFVLLGRADLLDGRDAWAPMALAAGRLLLRDSKRMVCVDVAERGER